MRSAASTVPCMSPRGPEMRCREMHAGLEICGWKNTWRQESIHVVLALRLVSISYSQESSWHSSSQRDTDGSTVKPQRKRYHSVLSCLSQSKTNVMSPRITAPYGKAMVFFIRMFSEKKNSNLFTPGSRTASLSCDWSSPPLVACGFGPVTHKLNIWPLESSQPCLKEWCRNWRVTGVTHWFTECFVQIAHIPSYMHSLQGELH